VLQTHTTAVYNVPGTRQTVVATVAIDSRRWTRYYSSHSTTPTPTPTPTPVRPTRLYMLTSDTRDFLKLFLRDAERQTRRHSRDDPREDVGVGVVEWALIQTRSIRKMLGPFATTSRLTPIYQVSPLYCRTPPAHRCPQRQRRRRRQRVTEGTAMAPWNGPNKQPRITSVMNAHPDTAAIRRCDFYTSTIFNYPQLWGSGLMRRKNNYTTLTINNSTVTTS